MFPKLLGRPAGRSPGVLGTSWGPVGLGKLVDSMTSKLPPATRLSFGPVLRRSGSARLVPRSKNAQKTEDNARFDSKNGRFLAKNGRFTHPSWTMDGPRYTQASPRSAKKCHSQAKLALPRPRNLATDPQVGPTGLWHQEDVICNPPAPMVKEVYRDRITP